MALEFAIPELRSGSYACQTVGRGAGAAGATLAAFLDLHGGDYVRLAAVVLKVSSGRINTIDYEAAPHTGRECCGLQATVCTLTCSPRTGG